MNGEWDVEWMNSEQTVGRCKVRPVFTFEYMFHAPDGSCDYKVALWAAEKFAKANVKDEPRPL